MKSLLLIRVNCPDRDTADAISEALIAAKLAPCTNLQGPITSTYTWQGRTERGEEWVLWIKARAEAFDAIEALIRTHHPHEVPAILALPVARANGDFLQWVMDNTASAG